MTDDNLRHLPPKIVVLLGPTAVGKSALSLELAVRYQAEIVTADSRQVYRYMDIGTAKPTASEQALVPHYMIDLVQPDDTYSAHRYRQEGRRVLARLGASGRMAIVSGGTGFYVRALLGAGAMAEVPPNEELRRALREEARISGAESLYARLRLLDPESARRIHARNLVRVIRALEIVDALGRPVPAESAGAPIPALYLGIGMDRSELDRIANNRVIDQVRAGLVEESRLLLEMGYSRDLSPMQGFGYRQMTEYLAGEASLEAAIAKYQRETRRYIRRQMTWFRADKRIQWIQAGTSALQDAVGRIDRWLESVT